MQKRLRDRRATSTAPSLHQSELVAFVAVPDLQSRAISWSCVLLPLVSVSGLVPPLLPVASGEPSQHQVPIDSEDQLGGPGGHGLHWLAEETLAEVERMYSEEQVVLRWDWRGWIYDHL